MKKYILLFLLLTFPFSLLPSPVHAQSASLSVSPPVVEIMLAPNKQVSQTFTLKTSGENLDVTPELHLAKPKDSNGHMTIDLNPLNTSSIPLTINIAGPNTSPTLTFSAANTDVPQDIYLALVFKTNIDPLRAGSSRPSTTSLSPAISALILVTINPSGVIPINLEINDFSPSLFHDSWLPLTIKPAIENKSDTMIRPLGSYEIISPRGKTVFTTSLYPNLILGNSSRNIMGFHSRSEGSPHSGSADVAGDPIPLTWSPKWSNIGPYRLHLTVTTQGGTKISEIEKVVWVIPLRLTIILSLIVVIVVFALRRNKPIIPTYCLT